MKTILKILAVLAVVACVVTLFSACNSEDGDDEDEDDAGIYSVTYNDIKIVLGKSADKALKKLGAPKSSVPLKICGDLGEVIQYTYNGMVLNVLKSDTATTVEAIVFTDDFLSTSEGICIGMSSDSVLAAHGTPSEQTDAKIEYESGSCLLRFMISNGAVKDIHYIYSTQK